MTFKHSEKFPFAPRAVWQGIDEKLWNDWHWQQQNRLKTVADFENVVELTSEEKQAFGDCGERFKVAVTPYYAALITSAADCPIRLQAVPSPLELNASALEKQDPLGEEAQSPVAGIVHRYPDRVLLYTNHNCPVYCRFCTQKTQSRRSGFDARPRRRRRSDCLYRRAHEQIAT